MEIATETRQPFPEEHEWISKAATCADNCGFRLVLDDAWTGYGYLEGGLEPRNESVHFEQLASLPVDHKPQVAESEPLEEITHFDQLPDFPTEPIHRNRDIARSFTSIASDFEEISNELMEYFGQHPDEMYHLDPRKWEKLLAAVFANQGYSTELGPGRGDGGVDIRLVQQGFYRRVPNFGAGETVPARQSRDIGTGLRIVRRR